MGCRYADSVSLTRVQVSSSVNLADTAAAAAASSAPLSKLDRVKLFVELLIKTIGSDDMLSIVTFATSARVVQPLRRMTDDAKVYSLVCSVNAP